MELNQQSDPFLPAPSAKALPHLLRQKLTRQLQQRHIPTSKTLLKGIPSNRTVPAEDRHRLYTASEIEDEIQRVAAAVASTQRHIQLGEESYYEETFAHGSIFAGWDGFIDNRDIATGNGSGSTHSSAAPMRRMPQDHRWFSSSHAAAASGLRGASVDHSQTWYLPPPNMDHGKPITLMTEEEAAAMELEQQQAQAEVQAQANPSEEVNPQTNSNEDEAKEDVAKKMEEPETQDEPADDNKKQDRKGKRKAAVPPPVSTRPKRNRK